MDKERPVPDMYEFETNDKGERVVKEAISDLAVNFPRHLCPHWIDASACACSGEVYNQRKEVGSLCHDGGRTRCKGKVPPMVMETFGNWASSSA